MSELKNEDNMDPEEVKRLKENHKLNDSTQTMLDGTEIFANKFGYPESEETTTVSSSGHQGMHPLEPADCQEKALARCLGVLI
eukprot:6761716-Pyramimonas_sp.AAC.1